MPRRFPIFQFPNPPLIATMAAAAFARITQGTPSRRAMQLSRLGLLWWSAEEIMSGANWFRRLLGVAAGTYSLATLKHPRTGQVSNRWAQAYTSLVKAASPLAGRQGRPSGAAREVE